MLKNTLFVLVLLSTTSVFATDLTLKPIQIGQNVYAVIGDTGSQTYENDGLNSNLGFVVTPEGVVVINSGPSSLSDLTPIDA